MPNKEAFNKWLIILSGIAFMPSKAKVAFMPNKDAFNKWLIILSGIAFMFVFAAYQTMGNVETMILKCACNQNSSGRYTYITYLHTTFLPTFLPTYYLPTYIHTYLDTHLPTYNLTVSCCITYNKGTSFIITTKHFKSQYFMALAIFVFYYLFGKILNLLCSIFQAIWGIFAAGYGQILNN